MWNSGGTDICFGGDGFDVTTIADYVKCPIPRPPFAPIISLPGLRLAFQPCDQIRTPRPAPLWRVIFPNTAPSNRTIHALFHDFEKALRFIRVNPEQMRRNGINLVNKDYKRLLPA